MFADHSNAPFKQPVSNNTRYGATIKHAGLDLFTPSRNLSSTRETRGIMNKGAREQIVHDRVRKPDPLSTQVYIPRKLCVARSQGYHVMSSLGGNGSRSVMK